jgi:PhoPQ-activated pathogenicity-related protein
MQLGIRFASTASGCAAAFVAAQAALSPALQAGALEDYVRQADDSYAWKRLESRQLDGVTVTHLELISQTWRGHRWQHHLQVVRPKELRRRDIAFLFITGDGDGKRSLWVPRIVAERAGALGAVVTRVPNQPLYEGRKEDALIAYTFDQYIQTGEETWPLLLPMAKSAVRAMDAIQAFAAEEHSAKVERFVVGGASKRGWTTWLSAAVDGRVKAIAPMVIDMLNMSAQVQWAEKVYGRQSEEIQDYTDLNLIARIDEPPMRRLRQWVDPYSYRERYTMPKLILLGSNDPYWTVDSLRHYWNDLPAPKLIFQTPNAGHDLAGGQEAVQSLAAFFQMVAEGEALPAFKWIFSQQPDEKVAAQVSLNRPAKAFRLWTADSKDRDFRDETWTSRPLPIEVGNAQASATIDRPTNGYRAYLIEALLTTSSGHDYKLSTEARVTPDLAN